MPYARGGVPGLRACMHMPHISTNAHNEILAVCPKLACALCMSFWRVLHDVSVLASVLAIAHNVKLPQPHLRMGDVFVSGIHINVYRQFPDATCLRKAFGSWQQGATPGSAIYWHWLLQGFGN